MNAEKALENLSRNGFDAKYFGTAAQAADYLAARPFTVPHTVKRLAENTGGAGGFAAGIDLAYGLGFDAFWVMDDDSVCRPSALAPLLRDLEDA